MYRPEIIEEARDAASVRLRFTVSPALAYFAGHFAGWPILPGIVQVHWAIEWARRYFDCAQEFRRMDNLKFHRVVQPNIELIVSLRYDAEKSRLDFTYENATAKYSSGTAIFGPG